MTILAVIRQLTSLPRFNLFSHGLEVAPHSVHADRDAVDERERLRVFREHRVKTPNSTKLAFAPKDAGPDRDRANDLFHTKEAVTAF